MPKTAKSPRKSKKSYIANQYVSDCFKNDMLYAAIVRSPLSSGKITNISFGDLPEGYILYTARDIPGKNRIVTLNTTTRVFCSEHVHYLGEPVGILVGPDLLKVRQLAKDIQITFDVTTIESALKEVASELKKAPHRLPEHIAEHVPDQNTNKDNDLESFVDMMNVMPSLDALPKPETNMSYTQPSQITHAVDSIKPNKYVQEILAERNFKYGVFETAKRVSTIEKLFTSADFDVKGEWTLDETPDPWRESNGAFCYMDNTELNVLTTTQWPSHLLKNLSTVLDMEPAEINIQKTNCPQTSSNGIWRCTTIAVQTALAAFLSKKPVKLLLTKDEQYQFMPPGIKTTVTHRTAVDKDGTIKAMKIDFLCDAGYANPFAEEIAGRMAVSAASFYNVENLCINVKVVSSPNPPTSVYNELFDSQAFFAVESQIQKICEITGNLPHEIRLKNLNCSPKTQKSPFVFNFASADELMKAIMGQSDFLRKYTTYRINSLADNVERGNTFFNLPRRGIGISCAYDGSCFYGTNFPLSEQKMEVELTETNAAVIRATCPSASASSIWKKIVEQMLEISGEAVSIDSSSSLQEESAMPETFYNDISIMTLLLKKCCTELQKKKNAGNPLPLVSKKAITPAMKKQWNNEAFRGVPFQCAAYGSAIVEVELNADTYQGKIKGIWLAVDCGEILSLKSAESSLRLSIQQELEHLLKGTEITCEEVNISFMQSIGTPCQIGKIVHNLIPAAFASALSLAFSQPIEKLPCTEQQLYDLTTIQENVSVDKFMKTENKSAVQQEAKK